MLSHLDHVNIVVSDLSRSRRFYAEVLGLRPSFEATLEGPWIDTVVGLAGVRARCVFLEFPQGPTRLELLQYLRPDGTVVPAHELPHTIGVRHLAFQVPDLDALCARLAAEGVETLSDPVTVPFQVAHAGRKRLCYFRDPDGVLLEAAEYRSE